ncbi:pyridine nucleotide-disulfide oxidoreductase [Tessaracoccus rhinocerotis]|uniref:ferredoxin--NADP(+) reductase n=1 Tax=Tessaracoccus rhinocerotis TaxID=1689449 RepID=A0A553K2Y4_9ACTN|nr:FAD-dependent oxidoreductase [Tessaracoccus rhinocerotis]TRY19051.1 pyridine nucleotide-disulfide oxidoreductase [Tessaracoccus rhinocerotis]
MDPRTAPSRRRVAVIGSGPSGLYTAEALLAGDPEVLVDVIDRLPAPYGLVRYGVAPDHAKMKSVARKLESPFDSPRGRFLGNVHVGADGIPVDALREHYHAVVHATGSAVDRHLGIEGEELEGSVGSGAFVSWYCGHPDAADLRPGLDGAAAAVVVGAGNVALDVARILARPAEDLAVTDLHNAVLDRLHDSAITDVHVLVRRGPQHTRFTPVELRALAGLDDVEVVVRDDDTLAQDLDVPSDRRTRQLVDTLTQWTHERPGAGGRRRIHLRFLRSPARLLPDGHGRVAGVEIERNEVTPQGRIRSTGEREVLAAGLVVRAIGYTGEPVPGLPFDEASGTIPNEAGRVVRDGEPVPGTYVAGWIKRGPKGVIGTNKGDGAETAASVLADLPTLPEPPRGGGVEVLGRLADHGIEPVSWAEWQSLDAAEVELGNSRVGAERIKIAEREGMLDAARGRGGVGGAG